MSRHTICLLNDSFPPLIDGVANTVVNYAKNIEAYHGHAVVVTPSVKGAVDEGYTYPVLRYPSIDIRKKIGYVAGYPFSPETVRRLQEAHTELLHTHCPVASALLARELRPVLNAPVVLTYHTKFDVDIAKMVKSRILQGGAAKALVQNIAACDEVWVVSEGAGQNLRSLGYEGEYRVMHNGVDVPRGCVSEEAVAAATGAYDLPRALPTFLFVGRMMWYKGLRIILDALAALKAGGTAFRMVFVGDGGDGAEVRAYAKELGLDDCCLFTGAIADRETIRAWYTRADAFLFPSTYDTNGLVVREAAASATATVMVRGSCAAEGVTDGQNGFFIDENAASLAAKLGELCAAPETMRRVGEHAQSELYLSWEDAVAQAYARYEVVMENYNLGLYPKHRKPLDGILASQGELMDAFALLDTLGDEMRDGLVSS
nr:glycosyltransferase [Oscillospiraceae bacterium]